MAKQPRTTTSSKEPEQKPKMGRPIPRYTVAEKKQMTIEEEAKKFYAEKVAKASSDFPPQSPTTYQLYASSALCGLISSGRYVRAEELVEEAFKYADIMVRHELDKL